LSLAISRFASQYLMFISVAARRHEVFPFCTSNMSATMLSLSWRFRAMSLISLPLPFADKMNRNPEYADSPPKPKLCHLRIAHKVGSNKAEYRNRKSRVGCAHFASPSIVLNFPIAALLNRISLSTALATPSQDALRYSSRMLRHFFADSGVLASATTPQAANLMRSRSNSAFASSSLACKVFFSSRSRHSSE